LGNIYLANLLSEESWIHNLDLRFDKASSFSELIQDILFLQLLLEILLVQHLVFLPFPDGL
jgi:hypothetical protein